MLDRVNKGIGNVGGASAFFSCLCEQETTGKGGLGIRFGLNKEETERESRVRTPGARRP
ncbi:hypothetical protein KFK09_017591 [Dendrobium nobile]|uniref:Uncharacterized protein n=1 Tax=Dendrobium nobile TaxID=94219 RepID=A0A8T3B1D8_DENNO|nr:hypothetical protein KFK09_017591 [Dendrobium nobile]